eukprot:1399653-Pyramimonas_sp.AAC.1
MAIQRTRAIIKQLRAWRKSTPEYCAHVSDMGTQHNFQIMADDKEKKWCWQVPVASFKLSLFAFILNSPHWEFVAHSTSEANARLQLILEALVPSRLHAWLSIRDDIHRLPHLYTTVKSKCYLPAGGR